MAGAALLAACGQKGVLFLPTEAAARQRATLPQTVRPDWTRRGDTAPRAGTPPANQQPAAPSGPAGITAPPTQSELVPESTLSP